MPFKKYPISGYPTGSDEATPGAIINARNLIISRIGIAARRAPVQPLNAGDPCAQIRGIASAVSGPWFVWDDPTTGHTMVGNTNTGTAAPQDLGVGAAPPAGFSGIALPDAAGEILPVYPPLVVVQDPGTPFAYMTGWRLGCPRAQDITLTAELSVSAAAGASNPTLGFNPGDIAAYRAVLSYDRTSLGNNMVSVIGATGGRFLYARPANGSGVLIPTLQVRLPKTLSRYTTPYSNGLPGGLYTPPAPFPTYLTIYRSVLTADAAAAPGGVFSATPSDKMFEVFKTLITDTDISAGYIEFNEICPIGSEGKALYTNADVDSINLDNWLPPFADTFAQFKGTLFWGAPRDVNLRTSIVVSGPPPVFKQTVTVASGVISIPLPAGVTAVSLLSGQILSLFLAGGGAPTGDYAVTSVSFGSSTMVVHVSSPPANGTYMDCFASWGKLVVAGSILQLSLNSSANGTANKILVRLPIDPGTGLLTIPSQAYTQLFAADLCTAINISCNSGTPVVTASLNAGGSLSAATIMLEETAETLSNLGGNLTVENFGLPRSIESLTANIQPVTPGTSIQQINGLWWGPPGQYDSICPAYQNAIGSPKGRILKLIATKDALYIFKTDGIWLLTGDQSGGINWTITLLSDSVVAIASTAIDVFEDTVYAATNIGIVSITGAAISVISGGVQQEYQDALDSQGGVGNLVLSTSYKDFTLRLGVPVNGINDNGRAGACVTFVYSFISGQWLVGHELGFEYFVMDANLPAQIETPLSTRIAVKLFGPSGQVVRLPCASGTPYLCSAAVEGSIGRSFQTQATGEVRPPTDDTQTVTMVYEGTAGHYHFAGPIANPNADLTNAGIWDVGGDVPFVKFTSVAYSSDSTPEARILVTLVDPSPGHFAGAQTVYIPIDVDLTFAPLGDGSSAVTFNQVGILQTRRSSAKQLEFSFWLDTTNSYPYVAPTVMTVSGIKPDTVARNVIRSGVPAKVSRGSRLNLSVSAGSTPEERCEFSQLLVDATAIAGEEIQYA